MNQSAFLSALRFAVALLLAALLAPLAAANASENTTEQLNARMFERRAVDAVIWSVPIVAMDAMRQAFFRDAGARYNDIVFWSKPADWTMQFLTPNASIQYIYSNFNTKQDGPVVVDVPAATEGAMLYGTLWDAWQVPYTDLGIEGKAGKYLILPPDFKGEVPEGYTSLRLPTYNGFLVLRTIPKTAAAADVSAAQGLITNIKVYPLAKAGDPPEQRYVDMLGKPWNAIPQYDESYYASLARMVNEEPVQTKDLAMIDSLRTLGIAKGKEFNPDSAQQALFKSAANEAYGWLMDKVVDFGPQFWPDRKWLVPVAPIGMKTDFKWETPDSFAVEERAINLFYAFGPPKKLGGGSFYLSTFNDAKGKRLSGENTYRLHVPADVPVHDFWSVTVYDAASSGFIRQMPGVSLSSLSQMKKNTDGSVDIYFGPTPPNGEKSNWIPTVPGRAWFQWFRFFGTEKALFEKTWKLPDVELVTP